MGEQLPSRVYLPFITASHRVWLPFLQFTPVKGRLLLWYNLRAPSSGLGVNCALPITGTWWWAHHSSPCTDAAEILICTEWGGQHLLPHAQAALSPTGRVHLFMVFMVCNPFQIGALPSLRGPRGQVFFCCSKQIFVVFSALVLQWGKVQNAWRRRETGGNHFSLSRGTNSFLFPEKK